MNVAGRLALRARLMAAALEDELLQALALLGAEAAASWRQQPLAKAASSGRPGLSAAVEGIMRLMDIPAWINGRLLPLLHAHAGRTALDTARILREETGLDFQASQLLLQELQHEAGTYLRVPELESQVRESLARMLEEGLLRGDNPQAIGRRIRAGVPAGRFVHAGPKYRANLIARNETGNMQRAAELAMLEANPRIVAVRCRDGIFGPPRSDMRCIGRDGEVVDITQVRRLLPFHPMCTLGLDPILS